MSKEFHDKFSIDGHFPVGISNDTLRPRMTVVHFGENPLRQEHYGTDDTMDVLLGLESFSFGKFEVDKYFDEDGDMTDWNITLHPQISDSDRQYIDRTLEAQPDDKSREQLEKLYKYATPVVSISPNEGIIMSMSKSEIHMERGKEYKVLSDGSRQPLMSFGTDEHLHYNDKKGITLKMPTPGVDGVSSLLVDGNLKHLSVDTSEIIRRLDALVREDQIDQEKIRLIVNVNMSMIREPSDGTLVRQEINR